MNELAVGSSKKLTLAPHLPDGTDGNVDGVPTWDRSDLTVATLAVAEDGMSAAITGKAEGPVTVKVTAVVDLGTGVHTLTRSIDFQVTHPEASGISIDVSDEGSGAGSGAVAQK
jgi:hypothetical protein